MVERLNKGLLAESGPTLSQATRCYSPSLDIGWCVPPPHTTYNAAAAKCAALEWRNASDWRLPATAAEAGAACGR